MTAKNILKKWFANFKKPMQEQFWAWLDSYWHKDEKIPTKNIEGLDDIFGDVATKTEFQNLEKEVVRLIENIPRTGIQHSLKIDLKANVPTAFDLPENAYFYGLELLESGTISIGTNEENPNDLGEVNFEETPILEIGLTKISRVWVSADTDTSVEPIIYVKG